MGINVIETKEAQLEEVVTAHEKPEEEETAADNLIVQIRQRGRATG
jgi:hypothetical protein